MKLTCIERLAVLHHLIGSLADKLPGNGKISSTSEREYFEHRKVEAMKALERIAEHIKALEPDFR